MPIALSNFFGTLNDNAFKQATILALALTIGIGGEAAEMSLNATISSVFILPFILFSFIAGWAGDRFSRKKVMVIAKAAEFPIMLIGMIALMAYTPEGSKIINYTLYSCIFLMALQSTFFVPARSGIMPQLFNEQEIKDAEHEIEKAKRELTEVMAQEMQAARNQAFRQQEEQEIMQEQRHALEQKRREVRAEQEAEHRQAKTHHTSSVGSWISSIFSKI